MSQGNRQELSARQEGAAIALFLLLAFGLTLFFAYRDQLEIFRDGTSRGQVFGRDFAVFWTASLLASQGDVLTIFDSDVFRAAMAEVFAQDLAFMPFSYPPHALFVFLPLAWVPDRWSFTLWIADPGRSSDLCPHQAEVERLNARARPRRLRLFVREILVRKSGRRKLSCRSS